VSSSAEVAASKRSLSAVRLNSQGHYLLGPREYSSQYFIGPEDFKEVGCAANEPATIQPEQ
jgi:hypothetical protein